MEIRESFGSEMGSQACLYCKEKDQMLRKYEKLVDLLKKRVKRCNSNAIFTINSMESGENANVLGDLPDRLMKVRNSGFASLVGEKRQSLGFWQKEKTINLKLSYTKKSRLSQPNLFFATAPSCFNRNQSTQTHKKINLSTQWLKKFTELNKKLSEKEDRINILIDQIFSVKNEYLYIRSIFLNLLKSLKMKDMDQKLTIDSKGKDIINLILHIFQYSEEEMKQIFGLSEKENRKTCHPIDGKKEIYLPRHSAREMR